MEWRIWAYITCYFICFIIWMTDEKEFQFICFKYPYALFLCVCCTIFLYYFHFFVLFSLILLYAFILDRHCFAWWERMFYEDSLYVALAVVETGRYIKSLDWNQLKTSRKNIWWDHRLSIRYISLILKDSQRNSLKFYMNL